MNSSPIITKMQVIPVAGYDSMLMTLSGAHAPCFTRNLVILEDNAVEYNLNEAKEYIVVTQTQSNAVELTQLSAFQEAGFSGSVYIGIIANTPRLPECQDYLDYLISTD